MRFDLYCEKPDRSSRPVRFGNSEVQFQNIEKGYEFVVLLRKLVCTDLTGFQNLSGLSFEIRGVKNLTGLY